MTAEPALESRTPARPGRTPIGESLRSAATPAGLWRLAPSAVSALAILGSFVGYFIANGRLWFFGDDWSFIMSRSLRHNTVHNLFAPHNEHWSTVPIVIYRTIYAVFGLHHYRIFVLPVLFAHVGICVLIWVLMRRAGASPWATTGGVVLAAVCGGGAENLEWDFQIGFVGSVFFGLLAILLIDTERLSRMRIAWIWVVLVLGLMCSGIGVPMVVAAAVFAALRQTWRSGLITLSVPAVVFVLWYLAYGHTGTAADKVTVSERLKTPSYVWQGLTNTWQVNTAIPSAGALILAAICLPVLVAGARDRLGRLAIALLAGEAALFILTGWTRVRFGTSQATASRYVYISTMLTVVAAVWTVRALTQLARERAPGRRPVPIIATTVLVTALTVVAMGAQAHQDLITRQGLTRTTEDRILGAAALIRQGVPIVNCCPEPHYNSPVNIVGLHSPNVLKALPDVKLTPEQEIAARGVMQVYVSAATTVPAMHGTVALGGRPVAAGSCLSEPAGAGQPALITNSAGLAAVTITTNGAAVDTQLTYQGMTSPVLEWPIGTPGVSHTVRLLASQPGATVVATVPPGATFVVCRS